MAVEHRGGGADRRRLPTGRSATAFLLAGTGILASAVAPVALSPFAERAWAAGLVLVGGAVVAGAFGLAGVAAGARGESPRLATVGLVAAAVAGLAAAGLIVLAGGAVFAEAVVERALPRPMGVFVALAGTMAGGFSLGSLLVGAASWRTATPTATVGSLLVAGGAVLAVPVVGELLGPAVGVEVTMTLLGPVILLVAVDALAVGYSIRAARSTG